MTIVLSVHALYRQGSDFGVQESSESFLLVMNVQLAALMFQSILCSKQKHKPQSSPNGRKSAVAESAVRA